MKRLIFIISLYSLSNISANSQTPDFSFKNISINEGLSQSSVVDIAQDNLGFMWFATQDGLNRFDGSSFVYFSQAFDDITSPDKSQIGKIVAAPDGKIWMITTGGTLKVLNHITQKISTVKTLTKNKSAIPSINCLLFDNKNNLWMGTINEGIWLYNKTLDTIIKYNNFGNTIQSIYQDKQQNIWVLSNKGLQCATDKVYNNYLPNTKTSSITSDINNNLWVGSFGQGLYLKNVNKNKFEIFKGWENNLLPENLVIESVQDDENGNIWVGTYGNGLYIINPTDFWIKHILSEKQNPFSLGFNDVLCIKKDANGNIWLGTDGGGISYYNKHFNNFKLINTNNVPSNIAIEQIRSIAVKNKQQVIIGTSNNGVTAADILNNTFKTLHLKPFKKGITNYDRIVSLAIDVDEDVWLGTNGNGLLIADNKLDKTKKWFTTESIEEHNRITDNTVWCMLPQKNNSYWLGTSNGGLILLNKEIGLLKNYTVKNSALKPGDIKCIVSINDSVLCLGFEKIGIQFFNTVTERFWSPSDSMQKNFTGQTVLKSLYWQKPFLWMGTLGKGIIVYNINNNKIFYINAEKDGLPNNTVYGILPEHEAAVWISTNKGIAQVNYKNISGNFLVNQINQYTVKDGLQSNEFNTGAYFKHTSGELYFGGIKGLNSFNPSQLLKNKKTIPVYITSFSVSNIPYNSDTLITYKKEVKLSFRQNSISFNYTALDFVSPEKLNFEYQLENYDNHWINAGNRTYTAYTNLPAGNYFFKVRVVGDASKEHKGLHIIIASPIWARWWFIAASIFIIIALLYLFYKSRINQLLKIQQVRNKISADLHDDIGSRLTNIQLLSAISRQHLPVNDKTGLQLDQIQEQVYSSAEALDEIVWNMKMKDDAINDITARMRRYASEVFESDNILYTTTIDDVLEGNLSMEKRRDIYLVFREILNNIRKHAKAKNVAIRIGSKNETMILDIKDYGVGFDINQNTNRNGLVNIKERILKWKGKIDISSTPKIGTRINISLPFNKKSLIKRIFKIK